MLERMEKWGAWVVAACMGALFINGLRATLGVVLTHIVLLLIGALASIVLWAIFGAPRDWRLVSAISVAVAAVVLALSARWYPQQIQTIPQAKTESLGVAVMPPKPEALDQATIQALVLAFKEATEQQARAISNKTLSESAIAFAKKMRAFERKFKEQQDNSTRRWMQSSTSNPDSAFHVQIEETTRMYFDRQQEFRDTLLGQAVYLKDELERRLSYKPTSLEEKPLIAFQGMLAGVSPVSDAADYLEKLAHRLTPPSSSSMP